MITYRFPTNVSVDGVLQEYVIQREKLKGINILPFQNLFTQRVVWDELDREQGATAPHNMDADPKIGRRPGSKRREYTPIPHKETDVLRESDILMPAMVGTLGGVIDVTMEIGRIMKARADKNFLRAEIEIWQALKGSLVINENGVVVNETFPIQTYNALVPWSTRATATPLRDFNAVKQLYRFTGSSADGATAYLNQATMNWLLENTNDADMHGFQNQNFLKLPYSMEEINKILTARHLPIFEVYNEGYVDDAGVETYYLADGEVVIVGKRTTGEKLGDYGLTPSTHRVVNGQPAPGFFSITEVNGQPNPGAITVSQIGSSKNPKIEITGGMYGGPRIKFPRSIVKMNVGP